MSSCDSSRARAHRVTPQARFGRSATRGRRPALSKSSYLAGVQCERRVWLQMHEREVGTPPAGAARVRLDAGVEIGECARKLFPGGVLVLEEPWEHAQAVERTRSLVDDPDVPFIFEAAFEFDGVRVRVDVLERLRGNAWGLREVKATSSVKAEHLDDIAVQRLVLEGSGLRVDSCELIHIDTTYVRGEGPIDWQRFFLRVDCGAATDDALGLVPERVRRFHEILGGKTAPDVEPGLHCARPHECEFWDHCTRDKPDDWVWHLPRLQEASFLALREAGHERISELPEGVELTETQERVREVLRSGGPFVSPELKLALGGTGPPAWYLDFETASAAVPLFAGTRPYQALPFQWSLHHVDAEGTRTHAEFLADAAVDPRRAFGESLIEALGSDDAPIQVYSHFEGTHLVALARECPDLAPALEAIWERLVDQQAWVRQHVYHADFECSFSIKKVAPALVPGFGWGGLDRLDDGSAAAAAWTKIARGALDGPEEGLVREALRAYCARDTLALVELHRALLELPAS